MSSITQARPIFIESLVPFTKKKSRMVKNDATNCSEVLNGLPLKLILDHLSLTSIQNIAASSKELKSRVSEVESGVRPHEVKKLIEQIVFLIESESALLEETRPVGYEAELVVAGSVIGNIKSILTTLNPSCLLSLALLKKHLFTIRDKLIVALSPLNVRTLDAIQVIIPPVFFEQLFQVTKITKEVSSYNAIQNVGLRKAFMKVGAEKMIVVGELDRAIPLLIFLQSGNLRSRDLLSQISGQLSVIKRFKEALDIALTIPDQVCRQRAIKGVCSSLSRHEKFDEAITAASKITTPLAYADAIIAISKNMIRVGEINKACDLISGMQVLFSKDRTLLRVSQFLSHIGRFEDAKAFASMITDELCQDTALVSIGIDLISAKKFKKAQHLIDEARQCVKDMVLLEMTKILSESKKFTEAKNLLLTIDDDRIQSDALGYLSVEMCKNREFGQAFAILEQIKDDDSKDITLIGLADVLCRHREFEEAVKICWRITDVFSRGDAMRRIVIQLYKIGEFRKAENLALTIENESLKALAIRGLISHLSKTGRFKKALRLIDLLKGGFFVFAITEISLGMTLVGRVREATEILSLIPSQKDRVGGLINLVGQLCQSGKFDEAFAIAHKEIDLDTQVELLACIFIEMGCYGRCKDALKGIDTIEDKLKRDEVLCELSESLSEQYSFDQAHLVALRINSEELRDHALININKGLIKTRAS